MGGAARYRPSCFSSPSGVSPPNEGTYRGNDAVTCWAGAPEPAPSRSPPAGPAQAVYRGPRAGHCLAKLGIVSEVTVISTRPSHTAALKLSPHPVSDRSIVTSAKAGRYFRIADPPIRPEKYLKLPPGAGHGTTVTRSELT
jgi:hypothetical protein